MSTNIFPNTKTPLLPFFQGVEIYGEVSPKLDPDGEQKVTKGLAQWAVPVVVPYGRLAHERKVTVLSSKKPSVEDGELVRFIDLHVGAYSSGNSAGIYLWATQIQKVDDAS